MLRNWPPMIKHMPTLIKFAWKSGFKQGSPRVIHSVLITSAARSRRLCLKRHHVCAGGKRLCYSHTGRGRGLADHCLLAPVRCANTGSGRTVKRPTARWPRIAAQLAATTEHRRSRHGPAVCALRRATSHRGPSVTSAASTATGSQRCKGTAGVTSSRARADRRPPGLRSKSSRPR